MAKRIVRVSLFVEYDDEHIITQPTEWDWDSMLKSAIPEVKYAFSNAYFIVDPNKKRINNDKN